MSESSKNRFTGVEVLKHDDERKNIPTAEYQSLLCDEETNPVRIAYERRNRDLDPQLVWRGKDSERTPGNSIPNHPPS